MLRKCCLIPFPFSRRIWAEPRGQQEGRWDRTTGRGIGPAYEDKVARRAIRLCDLSDSEVLAERPDIALDHHNSLRSGLDLALIDKDVMVLGTYEDRSAPSSAPGLGVANTTPQ
ncbi:MAG: hypothetical protein CM1200mP4_3970 [Rhodospirillaceae bacterium]|nr:MAG: hypothetical protein CM1200mP4_3970 [Rhodospirillaceae bacterium]